MNNEEVDNVDRVSEMEHYNPKAQTKLAACFIFGYSCLHINGYFVHKHCHTFSNG